MRTTFRIIFGILPLVWGVSAGPADPTSLEPCKCTDFEHRICGSDGKQYLNLCELECAQHKNPESNINEAPCAPVQTPSKIPQPLNLKLCKCNRILQPICASDGATYGNACQFKCALKQIPDLKEVPCTIFGRRSTPRSHKRKLEGNFRLRQLGRRPDWGGRENKFIRHDSSDSSSESDSESSERLGRRGFNRKHNVQRMKLKRGDSPLVSEDYEVDSMHLEPSSDHPAGRGVGRHHDESDSYSRSRGHTRELRHGRGHVHYHGHDYGHGHDQYHNHLHDQYHNHLHDQYHNHDHYHHHDHPHHHVHGYHHGYDDRDHGYERGVGEIHGHDHGHNDGHDHGHNDGHDHGHNDGHGHGHNNGHGHGHNNGHDHGHNNGHHRGRNAGHHHSHDHSPSHGHPFAIKQIVSSLPFSLAAHKANNQGKGQASAPAPAQTTLPATQPAPVSPSTVGNPEKPAPPLQGNGL